MRLILFLISLNLYANYGNKPEVDNCLAKSLNKLIVPSDAAMTVQKSCLPEMVCVEIPPNFSCIYFGFVAKTQVTECTTIPPEPPPDTTPTEPLPPVVPQCDSIQCPMGQTRSATDTAVTCSWSALELDPAKESAYNAQKAAAESTSAVYQESILYGNLQGYCNYVNGVDCVQLPPATFNATASSFSYITGKPLAEVKKLMKKKVKK